jgi:tRNA dimethylallyltransferase
LTQYEYNSNHRKPVPEAYPLIAVIGPTGSGKSALAVRLAAEFNGEIVNCDSVQVYAGLNVGAAKTPVAERMGIPHHLLDVIDPAGELTAGEYARQASWVLAGIRERRAVPVIAGGTGFYLRALLHGLSPAPQRNQELRERLTLMAARRPLALHRFLRKFGPTAAARIHANDHQKLIRAIEFIGQAAEPRRGIEGFRVLKIGLNPARSLLYEKLNQRAAWMFENGLLDETRSLLERRVPLTAKALATLGYRQAVGVLREQMTLAEAIGDCQLRTRHYAKRQITWFRKETDVQWLADFGDDASVQATAAEWVREFLQSGNDEPIYPIKG